MFHLLLRFRHQRDHSPLYQNQLEISKKIGMEKEKKDIS
jgi:hypothetical protein